MRILETFGKLRRGLNLRFVDDMRRVGLGTKQGMVLRYLIKHASASQAQLSRATMTDPAAVNRLLEGLLKKKWVGREDDPSDRRRWIVKLTKEGAKIAKQVDAVFDALADEVFSALAPSERKIFLTLLERLIEGGLSAEIQKELST